ncbi:DUF4252 domain-containing protein [uncultured Paludibaculum sp.]|uniref:DUF4252 domain-containing protein n=1 Tax=uncultured Paludibaculum sp. TaxID=1765020 RepID=UPI002AAB2D4C|nr:DUF4252 domain-containing protein [uncultured Paludibaculum sp.]
MMFRSVLVMVMAAGLLPAQQIKFPAAFDKLADKAAEVVNVTLDPQTLAFATRFLSDKKDEADVKRIAQKLKGIYVRGYEFDKEGEYSQKDIDDIRAQLKGPEWSVIVSTHSRRDREISEIYLHRDGGLLIIAAEPKELTIVNIMGHIDPSDLTSLGGQFGIPKVTAPAGKGGKKGEKDEEE